MEKLGRFRLLVSESDVLTACFFRVKIPTVWVEVMRYDTNAPIKWAKRKLR